LFDFDDGRIEGNPILNKAVTMKMLMENPPPMPEDLIDGVLGASELVNFSGPWKVGKTWFALDLMLAVSDIRRDHFLGHAIKAHGPVVYLDAENTPSVIYERIQAFGYDGQGHDVHYVQVNPREIRFDVQESAQQLLAAVQEIKPVLVVVDSLLRFYEQDENSAQGISRLFDGLAPLKEAGVTVVLLDHQARTQHKGPRGSGDKQAFVDRIWTLGLENEFIYQNGVTWSHKAGTRRGTPVDDQKIVLKTGPNGIVHLEVQGDEDSQGLSASAIKALHYIAENAESNKGQIRLQVFGTSRTVCDVALGELVKHGLAKWELGTKSAHLWSLTEAGSRYIMGEEKAA
jgi:KaiC/GvpD/RAD55 family RecA-like ATPase